MGVVSLPLSMGLEKIIRKMNAAMLLPAVVASVLLTPRPTYAESPEKYSLPATRTSPTAYLGHRFALVPRLRLEMLAQNVPTDEESRPGAYYITPNNSPPPPSAEPAPPYLQPPVETNLVNPNTPSAEPAPAYLRPPNTAPTNPASVPQYLQPQNPSAESGRNDENDYVGWGLVITGSVVAALGIGLATVDDYTGCEYTACTSVKLNRTPLLLGAAGGVGLAGLGIYMLLD